MNVQQLLNRVYRQTNWKYLEKAHIIDMFNDAQNQLADDAKLEASSAIVTVVDQANYTLPSNFKAPISLIEGTISNPDAIYDLVNVDENRYGYALYGGSVYIKPAPSAVKTLNLYYYKYPAALVDEDSIPDIDPFFHDLLATYAIAQIMMIPGTDFDKGTYDRAFSDWDNGKLNFLKAQGRKHKRSRVNERIVW